jgi:hypothetical protein
LGKKQNKTAIASRNGVGQELTEHKGPRWADRAVEGTKDLYRLRTVLNLDGIWRTEQRCSSLLIK